MCLELEQVVDVHTTMYLKFNNEPCGLHRHVHLSKDIIFQQHNTAEDQVYISKPQMLKILNTPERPA